MQRPPEYENLIKMGYFHEVAPTSGFKEQYLKVAEGYLQDAAQANTTASRYLLGYEAYYQVVQAVLEQIWGKSGRPPRAPNSGDTAGLCRSRAFTR